MHLQSSPCPCGLVLIQYTKVCHNIYIQLLHVYETIN